MILGPLQLALLTTAIGAYYGNVRKGALIGFGVFVSIPLLFAVATGLVYLLG